VKLCEYERNVRLVCKNGKRTFPPWTFPPTVGGHFSPHISTNSMCTLDMYRHTILMLYCASTGWWG